MNQIPLKYFYFTHSFLNKCFWRQFMQKYSDRDIALTSSKPHAATSMIYHLIRCKKLPNSLFLNIKLLQEETACTCNKNNGYNNNNKCIKEEIN